MTRLPIPREVFTACKWTPRARTPYIEGECFRDLDRKEVGKIVVNVKGGGIKPDDGRAFSCSRSKVCSTEHNAPKIPTANPI